MHQNNAQVGGFELAAVLHRDVVPLADVVDVHRDAGVRTCGQRRKGVRYSVRTLGEGLRSSLRTEGEGLRSSLRTEGEVLRSSMRTEGEGLRSSLRTEGEGLRSSLRSDSMHRE